MSPPALLALTRAAVQLADRVFTEIRIRMQAGNAVDCWEPRRLAEVRTFIASLVADAGEFAEQAFAEAASIYTTNLPGDWGNGLLMTFHSIAAEMKRCGTEPPDEPPVLETDAPTPAEPADEPPSDDSATDDEPPPGARILFTGNNK